jgi:Development and cell death domain
MKECAAEAKIVNQNKNAFIFPYNYVTESECLQRQLVGTIQQNAIWPMNIKIGDDIYLFNFSTGLIHGPFLAVSSADCHEPTAWGGKFPIQVRICKTPLTRQAYKQAANTPQILRKRRISGDLGEAAREVFSWLQECGRQLD